MDLIQEEFIKKLTDNLPEPPAYFPFNVKLNQQGYEDLSDIIKKVKILFLFLGLN